MTSEMTQDILAETTGAAFVAGAMARPKYMPEPVEDFSGVAHGQAECLLTPALDVLQPGESCTYALRICACGAVFQAEGVGCDDITKGRLRAHIAEAREAKPFVWAGIPVRREPDVPEQRFGLLWGLLIYAAGAVMFGLAVLGVAVVFEAARHGWPQGWSGGMVLQEICSRLSSR